jgi:hypothetical protein
MAGPWEEYQTTKAPAATGPIIVRSRDEVLGQLDRLNTPAAPPPSGPWTEYQQPAPPKATDEERRTVLGFLGNAAKSTGSLLGGLVNVPEQVKGMTSLFAGMAEKSGYKALPGQPDVNAVDALIAHYKDRYGSLEGFKKAMYEDPAGVMFDVATVLEPAGAGLKAAGLPRAAAATTRAARAMNPVVQTVRAGGAIARGAAPAVEFAAAGARAAAPDVAIGTAKIGAGYALEQMLPGAGPLKYAFELPTVYSGARQIQRGLKKGVAAGREALKARAAAAAEALAAETEAAAATAARPEPPPSIIPPERQLGPGPIITPPPADTSGTVRGLPPAQYPEVIPPGPLRTKPGASDAALAMREAMGLGQEEFRLPEASAPDFAAITQAGHVDRVARLMRENGLTAADALLLDPPDWINLARSAGIVKPDAGGALAREVVLRLQSLEPKPKAPAKPRTQPAAPEAAVVPPAPPPPAARVTPEAEALAREMPGYRAPEGELPRAPTASETRVETIAKAIAAYKIPMADLEQLAEHAPMVENLARSLKLARPAAGEIPLIVKRIRELRGAGPPAPPAAAAEATIRTDVQSTPTPGPPPREQPRGPRPPVYGPREPGQGTAPGRSAVVRVPGESTTYAGRYAVRDLGDVHASHNPHTFAKNPDYHFRNDRDYSDPTNKERVVVNSMRDVFDPAYPLADSPDATHGAPVIDSRGNVLGGNSRAMILDRVYTSNPEGAAAYRAELEKAAPQFGIEPQQFAHMKRPVLVRELSDAELGPERAQRAITDLNKRGTADLTTAERATSDARRMSPAAADYLAGQIEAEGAEASLTDVLAGKRGVEIINKLVDDGVFTMQEKPTLVDSRTGSVTAAAKERISKMLLGQVFESSDQLVRTPAEIRAKLERVVSPILQAGQKAGFDILPTVREAIDLVEYARVHGIKNLADAVAQESMFADAPRFSAEALQLADYLQARKPTEIAKAFRRYVANAEPTMYGESTAAEAFADAFGAAMPPEAAKMAPAEAEAAFQQQKAKAGKRKAPKAKN